MHRALYHRVGRLGVHDIEYAMDDLVTFEAQEEAPSIRLLSRSTSIFMNPLHQTPPIMTLTSFIAMVEISADLPVLRTSASVIPARQVAGRCRARRP